MFLVFLYLLLYISNHWCKLALSERIEVSTTCYLFSESKRNGRLVIQPIPLFRTLERNKYH